MSYDQLKMKQVTLQILRDYAITLNREQTLIALQSDRYPVTVNDLYVLATGKYPGAFAGTSKTQVKQLICRMGCAVTRKNRTDTINGMFFKQAPEAILGQI